MAAPLPDGNAPGLALALASLLQDNVIADALVSGLVRFVSLVASSPPQQALELLLLSPLSLFALFLHYYFVYSGQIGLLNVLGMV
jgi:hypothetical protein